MANSRVGAAGDVAGDRYVIGSSVRTRRADASPGISWRNVSGSVALPQMILCGPRSKTSPMRATAIAPTSGARGLSSTAPSTSSRTIVVDLVKREAGDLDRRVGEDQLLELDLKLVQVPLALLAKAIDGEAENALLGLAKMLDPNARVAAEAELPSRLDPNSRHR
jgi:hypothetical protein